MEFIIVLIAQGFLTALLGAFILVDGRKTRKDIQEVKTSQRASQKRERKMLEKVR